MKTFTLTLVELNLESGRKFEWQARMINGNQSEVICMSGNKPSREVIQVACKKWKIKPEQFVIKPGKEVVGVRKEKKKDVKNEKKQDCKQSIAKEAGEKAGSEKTN